MTTHTTGGRLLAIAAGILFATGTLAVLFEDVIIRGAPFSLKHYLTLVLVTGVIMVGHLAYEAWVGRSLMSCLGFGLVALAGTSLIVYSSLGRQTEISMISEAQHDEQVKTRVALESQLASDRTSITDNRLKADKECATGEGPRCRAARATVAYYEDSVKGVEARIALLKPAKPVAPEAEYLGTIAAALGYPKEQVKALAVLIAPFLQVLVLEFGTIVSFGFGFSPRRPVRTVAPAATAVELTGPTNQDTAQTDFPAVEALSQPKGFGDGGASVVSFPKRPNGGAPNGSNRRMVRSEVLSDLLTRNATGRGFRSQEEAAEHYGVSASRYSEWLKKWEAEGSITRRKVGRVMLVSA